MTALGFTTNNGIPQKMMTDRTDQIINIYCTLCNVLFINENMVDFNLLIVLGLVKFKHFYYIYFTSCNKLLQ
jgi:hypothetical protein